MRSLRLLLAALGSVAVAMAAHGADEALTIKNKIAQCQGCHGIADWKTAFPEIYRVPKLGGQKPAYIVAALKAYQKGERDFPTMRAIAAELTDRQMEELAAYYGAASAAVAEKK